jgi:hypothetical protein
MASTDSIPFQHLVDDEHTAKPMSDGRYAQSGEDEGFRMDAF